MKRFIGPLLALVVVALCTLALAVQKGTTLQHPTNIATLTTEVQYDVGIAPFTMTDSIPQVTGSPTIKTAGDEVTITAQAQGDSQRSSVLKKPMLASAPSLADSYGKDVGLSQTNSALLKSSKAELAMNAVSNVTTTTPAMKTNAGSILPAICTTMNVLA